MARVQRTGFPCMEREHSRTCHEPGTPAAHQGEVETRLTFPFPGTPWYGHLLLPARLHFLRGLFGRVPWYRCVGLAIFYLALPRLFHFNVFPQRVCVCVRERWKFGFSWPQKPPKRASFTQANPGRRHCSPASSDETTKRG